MKATPAITDPSNRMTMSRMRQVLERLNVRPWLWFLLLWLGGVAGTALLALPFRLLVAMALEK